MLDILKCLRSKNVIDLIIYITQPCHHLSVSTGRIRTKLSTVLRLWQ